MLHRLRVGGFQLLCPGRVHNRNKEGPRLPVCLASVQAGSVQQICFNRFPCTTSILYKYIIIMSTLGIKRKISYNNQQTVFHNIHNCPVRSIHWYLRSMRWLQCGNKDNPLFLVPCEPFCLFYPCEAESIHEIKHPSIQRHSSSLPGQTCWALMLIFRLRYYN